MYSSLKETALRLRVWSAHSSQHHRKLFWLVLEVYFIIFCFRPLSEFQPLVILLIFKGVAAAVLRLLSVLLGQKMRRFGFGGASTTTIVPL